MGDAKVLWNGSGWEVERDEGNEVMLTDGKWYFHSSVPPKDPRRVFERTGEACVAIERAYIERMRNEGRMWPHG